MTVRPIDASRFGKILEQWKKDCLEDNDTQGADIISDVILQLDDVPTITPQSEWVSVEDRLPDTAGEFLVVYHPCYWDKVTSEIRVGIDSFRGKTTWAKRKYQRVTHWMPLPEPPKGE